MRIASRASGTNTRRVRSAARGATASVSIVVIVPSPSGPGSYAHQRLEHARLATGDLDLRPATQLHVQLPAGAGLDFLDELDVDDLPPVRTEEPLRIEPLLQAAERTPEQRADVAPMQAHVVTLGDDQTYFVQRHEPAARAVADEQPFDDLGLARSALTRQRPAGSRECGGQAFRLDGLEQVV